MELVIVAVLGALLGAALMLLPLRAVNIRRMRAHARRVHADEQFVETTAGFGQIHELEKAGLRQDAATASSALRQRHADVIAEHEAAIAEQRQEYALSFQTSRIEVEGRDLHISNLKGEIKGLNSAHEVTQQWADRILRTHDWHIGGKGDPHEKGVTLIRYECACGAVTHAPEGSL